jgi:hypothetical protein
MTLHAFTLVALTAWCLVIGGPGSTLALGIALACMAYRRGLRL